MDGHDDTISATDNGYKVKCSCGWEHTEAWEFKGQARLRFWEHLDDSSSSSADS